MWYRFTYEKQTFLLSTSNFTHFHLYTALLRNKMFVNNLINTKSNINCLQIFICFLTHTHTQQTFYIGLG